MIMLCHISFSWQWL